jgi:hypothetical protein
MIIKVSVQEANIQRETVVNIEGTRHGYLLGSIAEQIARDAVNKVVCILEESERKSYFDGPVVLAPPMSPSGANSCSCP